MKNGSTFLMAVAVLCVLGLTQGCVTSESSGSGRGAGAKHKGFYKSDHKKSSSASDDAMVGGDAYGYEDDATMMDDSSAISESDYSSSVEPMPIAPAASSYDIYIVQKGDMLSQLAVDFDTTTANLVEINNLSNPDVLYVGQELRVPAGSARKSGTTSKSTGGIKKGSSYTIQKGDTLSEIALAAGVSIDDLRSLNGIQGDKIMAGETIDIPAYGSDPSSKMKKSSSSSASSQSSAPAPEPEPAPEPAAPVFEETATATAVAETSAPMEVDMVVDEVIYPGETLDDKARQYGVSKAEIMRLNGITDESQVKEGQTIRIPVAE